MTVDTCLMISVLLLWDKGMEPQLLCSRYRGSSESHQVCMVIVLPPLDLNSLREGRGFDIALHPGVYRALPIVSYDQCAKYFSNECVKLSSNRSNCPTLHQGDFHFSTFFLHNFHCYIFNLIIINLVKLRNPRFI